MLKKLFLILITIITTYALLDAQCSISLVTITADPSCNNGTVSFNVLVLAFTDTDNDYEVRDSDGTIVGSGANPVPVTLTNTSAQPNAVFTINAAADINCFTSFTVDIPECIGMCSLNNVMTSSINCTGTQLTFDVDFDATNAQGDFTISNSNLNQVGFGQPPITVLLNSAMEGTQSFLIRNIANQGCTQSFDIQLPNCPPLPDCGFSNFALSPINCHSSGDSVILQLSYTPMTASGLYELVGENDELLATSSHTNILAIVSNDTERILPLRIRDAMDPDCISDTLLVLILAAPDQAMAGDDLRQCDNSNFTLQGITPTTGDGTWTITNGNGSIDMPNQANTLVSSISPGDTIELRWTVESGACSTTDDIIIINDEAATIAIAGEDQAQCALSSFSLSSNVPSVGIGAWTKISGPGLITNPLSNTSDVTAVLADSTVTMSWFITNGSCISADTLSLRNDQQPETPMAGDDQVQCNNTSYVLSGSIPTVGMSSWSLISGNGIIATPTEPTSTITDVNEGTTTISYTIINGTCMSSDQIDLVTTIFMDSLHVDNNIISQGIPLDNYQANMVLTSDAMLPTGRHYNYLAGNNIQLHPFFSIEENAILEVYIQTCDE